MATESEKRKTHVALDTLERAEPSSSKSTETQVQKHDTRFWEPSVPRKDTMSPFKRKRIVPREDGKGDRMVASSDFQLTKAVHAGVRAFEYVRINHESPWKRFQKVYELEFQEFTTVAVRNVNPYDIVTVQKVDNSARLDILQQIRHKNFVSFLESFQFERRFYAILEYVSISLAGIVASPPYPTEPQLAAILGQVLSYNIASSICLSS